MGRRKIEIKPIKDDRNRSVTFLKRKGGLFKKAHELSVLCSVDVAVVIFSNNKKLYQYCSGDINEIISRHSYYDAPHESKGPADFAGKKDGNEMLSPERAGSHSSNDSSLPHHMHPLRLNRHTASVSPPNMPKSIVGPSGYPMGPRGTPQPMTRPSSRNQGQRRNGSNRVPPNGYQASQPPSHQTNGYSYMSHQHQPQHQQPQHPHPHQHQQPQPPVYGSQIMQPSSLNQMQYPQYAQQHHQPQTAAQQQAEAFINETNRRQSMPPAYNSDPPTSENEQPSRPDPPAPQPMEHKRAPAKSRSMFTPIGPSESMLAQHFGFGQEAARSHSIDTGTIQRKNAAELAIKMEEKSGPIAPLPPHPRSTSPPLHSRNNSLADPKSVGMRPKLKVRIPSENSDNGSPTESSPRDTSATAGNLSARPNNEGGPVVLPPPSPSHSVAGLLSAGATGPVNPFSRPPPTNNSQPEQTPMSALPSRFTESMLPSPSQFYGSDWMGLPFPSQRSGNNGDNMLPSPLNFQTPVGGNSAPFFKNEPETTNAKRRSPESDHSESSATKRQKNS